MKALLYTPSLPRFLGARLLGKRFPKSLLPLRLAEVPLPEREGFLKVRVRLSGVCGSDLALLYGKSPPTISPFFSFPAVLGHEILGEVEGSRVAVNPLLACAERGLPPAPCAKGGRRGSARTWRKAPWPRGSWATTGTSRGGGGSGSWLGPRGFSPFPKGFPTNGPSSPSPWRWSSGA